MFEDVEETRPDGEQPLKFYYNREERIAKAPEIVKKYYRGEMKPVKGFKVLFTKQNRWIFISLILFCGAALAYNGFNKSRDYALINTLDCELQAFSYEEEIYVNLKIKRNKKSENLKDVKNVTAEIMLIDPNGQVTEKRTESLTYEPNFLESGYGVESTDKKNQSNQNQQKQAEQYIRAKFTDFDIIRVDAVVNVDGEEKELSAQVKR